MTSGSTLFSNCDDLTVAIPTMNSGTYIDIVLEFYQDHGIPVIVFVDDRSSDDTFSRAKKFADNIVSISNDGSFIVETMIETIARACRTKWVLRIDDDELPTLAMLRFVAEAVLAEKVVHGFQRHQCAISREGRLLNHRQTSALEHQQWRLFQPAAVKFTDQIHTPGFVWEHEQGVIAGPGAGMIHLDWALHSYEERIRKLTRYDSHVPNAGTTWRAFYLCESDSSTGPQFDALDLVEFEKPCRDISLRFPDLCVDFEDCSIGASAL